MSHLNKAANFPQINRGICFISGRTVSQNVFYWNCLRRQGVHIFISLKSRKWPFRLDILVKSQVITIYKSALPEFPPALLWPGPGCLLGFNLGEALVQFLTPSPALILRQLLVGRGEQVWVKGLRARNSPKSKLQYSHWLYVTKKS